MFSFGVGPAEQKCEWRPDPFPIVLLLLTLASCAPAPASRDVAVDQWSAEITLNADGRLDVVEHVHVRTTGQSPEFVRVVPLERADRLEWVSARVDGAAPAVEPVITSAARPDVPSLRIPLPDASASHEVQLTYRVIGALQLTGTRGRLEWPALPQARDAAIGTASIDLQLADGLVPIGAPGIASAGWTVAWQGAGITASRADVPADDAGELHAEVSFAGRVPETPGWQYDADRARELMPAFVSGALTILVVAVGIVAILLWRYPSPRRRSARVDAPQVSDDLAADVRRARSLPRTRQDELAVAGLVDRERIEVVRGLRVSGIVVILFGLVSTVAVDRWLWYYDWPAVVMAASIVVAGLLFVAAAPLFPIVTPAGAAVARQYTSRL